MVQALLAIVLVGFCVLATQKEAFLCLENHDKLKLSDVSELTFKKTEMTKRKRKPPVRQLECIGGSAGTASNEIDIVKCHNRGTDHEKIKWECDANLKPNVVFGEFTVTCEGYADENDPYVLAGSCGLKYKLEYKHLKGSLIAIITSFSVPILMFLVVPLIICCLFYTKFRERIYKFFTKTRQYEQTSTADIQLKEDQPNELKSGDKPKLTRLSLTRNTAVLETEP